MIAAADEAGLAMVFTGMRHFRHDPPGGAAGQQRHRRGRRPRLDGHGSGQIPARRRHRNPRSRPRRRRSGRVRRGRQRDRRQPGRDGAAVDVLVIFVINADQVDSVLFGEDGAAAGQTWVGGPVRDHRRQNREIAAFGERDVAVIDGPVGGAAEPPAHDGDGFRPDAAFSEAAPVLDAIAEQVHRLGGEAGVGSTVKTINQLLAGVHIAAAAEAMALGINGTDPDQLFAVLSGAAGSSWMFNNRVPHIWPAIARRYRRSTFSSRIWALSSTPAKLSPSPCL